MILGQRGNIESGVEKCSCVIIVRLVTGSQIVDGKMRAAEGAGRD